MKYNIVLNENNKIILHPFELALYPIPINEDVYIFGTLDNTSWTPFILKNGIAMGWGFQGGSGILGINEASGNKLTPVAVYGNHTFCRIISSINGVLAIDINNQTWAWGDNPSGNIGDNTNIDKSTPVAICGSHTFCKIFIDDGVSSFAIDNNQKAWAWGNNSNGHLGNNSYTCVKTPIEICGNHTFINLYSKYRNMIGLDNNGKAWSWGLNDLGQLGTNNITCYLTPVAVYGNHTFCYISNGGQYHTIAIDNNGKAWAWGDGEFGTLGQNNTICYSTPIAVYGNHTFCYIFQGGRYHNILKDNHGYFWGLGTNQYGEFGINNTTGYSTPVQLIYNHCFIDLKLGVNLTIGIDNNNKIWSWGYNQEGSLGDNTTINKSTPVSVYGF